MEHGLRNERVLLLNEKKHRFEQCGVDVDVKVDKSRIRTRSSACMAVYGEGRCMCYEDCKAIRFSKVNSSELGGVCDLWHVPETL